MERENVIRAAKELRQQTAELSRRASGNPFTNVSATGAKAKVSEFLRRFAGPKSSFYTEAKGVVGIDEYRFNQLTAILDAFIEYSEAGLLEEVSPERRAQLDVVSDFLEQADTLLGDKRVHPGAAAMLIGAALEEFLRTWVGSIPLSVGNKKPGIQAFADALRKEELISKQDLKDLTAWGGVRNHAAHGEWREVGEKERIRIMLEGVNLFMRKYGASNVPPS